MAFRTVNDFCDMDIQPLLWIASCKQPVSTSTDDLYRWEPADNQSKNKPGKIEEGEREEYSSQTEQRMQRWLISQFCKFL